MKEKVISLPISQEPIMESANEQLSSSNNNDQDEDIVDVPIKKGITFCNPEETFIEKEIEETVLTSIPLFQTLTTFK